MSASQVVKTAATPKKRSVAPQAHPVARVGGEPVIISTRRVSLWYGQVIGVNDISLDIGPGVTGLLGPMAPGSRLCSRF